MRLIEIHVNWSGHPYIYIYKEREKGKEWERESVNPKDNLVGTWGLFIKDHWFESP